MTNLELVQSFPLHKFANIFPMLNHKREIPTKKSCKYGNCL